MNKTMLYAGCYTSAGKSTGGKGIYVFELSDSSLNLIEVAENCVNPSYLMPCRANSCLYSVSEAGSSYVNAFRIDPVSGTLKFINSIECAGSGMCHLVPDSDGRTVYTAQYNSGHVSAVSVNPDGSLGKVLNNIAHSGSGINKRRQEHQHAHSVTISPDGKYVYACDLGMDKIMIYRIAPDGSLTENKEFPWKTVAPGEGPRHIEFHPDGKHMYLVTEMGAKIMTYKYDPENGSLDCLQTSATLPNNFNGFNTAADIHITGDGKFLYSSNRGSDTIECFAVSPDGLITKTSSHSSCGETPRNFALSPDGAYMAVANQSGSLVLFSRNSCDGSLKYIEKHDIPFCVCAKFYSL